MAYGTFEIKHVAATNDYMYTWTTDTNKEGEVQVVATGKTKAQAWTDIGNLVIALGGTVELVTGNARSA